MSIVDVYSNVSWSECCDAGLDMGALSDMGDGSLGDATETDTASVSSEEQQAGMPAWAHALVDQVGFHSLHKMAL